MTVSTCRTVAPTLLSLLLLTILPAYSAPLYKWVDEQGHTHYSDQPPKDGHTEEISGQLPPLNVDETGKTIREMRGVFEEPRPLEKAFQKQQTELKTSERNQLEIRCAEARKQLEILRGRVVFIDAAGNPEAVSETERARRAEKLAAEISRYCH